MKKLIIFLVLSSLATTATVMAEPFPKVPVPADNPMTPAKIELGKMLFFDPRLSRDGSISCQSCHNVMAGGEDNRPNSVGVKGQHGGRSSPTVWNSAYMSVMFWDGRAKSLEEQAKGPMTNSVEMGMDSHDLVISRISKIPGYQDAFKKAFPKDPKMTIEHLAKAIASYERTLIAVNSPYDQYMNGKKSALSKAAIRGLALTQSVGCIACHNGPNFAGPLLPEGSGFYQKFPAFPGSKYDAQYDLMKDKGRAEVTKQDSDAHMYRVPTWRNIALTAPYFHNGSVRTLPEAVRVMAKTQLNKDLKDDEVSDLVEFLKSLTGKFPAQTMPRLPGTLGENTIND